MPPLPTAFRRNALANYANSLVALVLALVVTPLLVRGLGKEAYGTWVLCEHLGRLPQPAPVRLRPGDHEVRRGRARSRRPVEGPARRLDIRRRTLDSGRTAPCRSAGARVARPGRLQHSGRPAPCCNPRRAALDRRSCSGDSCGHIRRRPRRGPALRAPQPHDRRHGGVAGGRLGGHSCARRRPGPARDRDGVAQPHLSGGALPRDAPPARPGDSEPEVRGPRLRKATARDVKLGRCHEPLRSDHRPDRSNRRRTGSGRPRGRCVRRRPEARGARQSLHRADLRDLLSARFGDVGRRRSRRTAQDLPDGHPHRHRYRLAFDDRTCRPRAATAPPLGRERPPRRCQSSSVSPRRPQSGLSRVQGSTFFAAWETCAARR